MKRIKISKRSLLLLTLSVLITAFFLFEKPAICGVRSINNQLNLIIQKWNPEFTPFGNGKKEM